MDAGPGGRAWTDAMLATPGTDALRKFDIANIHVRTPAVDAARTVAGWCGYFAATGFAARCG